MVLDRDLVDESLEDSVTLAKEKGWFRCNFGRNVESSVDMQAGEIFVDYASGIFAEQTRHSLSDIHYQTSVIWPQQDRAIYGYQIKDYDLQQPNAGLIVRLDYPFGDKNLILNTAAIDTELAEYGVFTIGCPVNSITRVFDLPEVMEERLKRLSMLPERWDSYYAKKISAIAIENAKSILSIAGVGCGKRILVDSFVAPCSDGGVQLEFKSESENELVVKISPAGRVTNLLLSESSGEEKERQISKTEQIIWADEFDVLCNKQNHLR